MDADPTNHAALVQLAELLLDVDPARAEQLATAVPEEAPEHGSGQNIALLARLLHWGGGGDVDIPNQADASPEHLALYRDGACALRAGDPAAALEKWVSLVASNRRLDDDGARRACVASVFSPR